MEHFVGVELDTDHGLVAAAVKELVGATFDVIVLALLHARLQAVTKVCSVLGFFELWEVDDNALIVNHCPIANLTGLSTLSGFQYLYSEVLLEQEIQLGCLTW